MALEGSLAVQLALAAAIGLLVGMEREESDALRRPVGTRTLPIIAILGALGQHFRPDLVWLLLLLVGAYVGIAYVFKVRRTDAAGLTTTFTALLVFLLGVLTTHSVTGLRVAVVVGAALTAALAAKAPMHRLAGLIEERDRIAMAKFLIVALVALPFLPNERVDALLGLNPRFVWLMVVFVSSVELTGYLLTRWLGDKRGIAITGLAGGLVSSTATTVSLARRVRDEGGAPDGDGAHNWDRLGAGSIALAGLVTFPRTLVFVAVVAPDLVPRAAFALAIMFLGMLAGAAWLLWGAARQDIPPVESRNPFRLRPALVFGLIFAIVLLGTRYLQEAFGEVGIYVSALVGSIAGMEAISISLARIVADDAATEVLIVRALLVALATNLAVKEVLVAGLGTARLARLHAFALAGALVGGVVAFFLAPWP